MRCTFFIETKLEGGNSRQRHRWQARYGMEKRMRESWGLQFQAKVPRAILVDSPHPLRNVRIVVYRKRPLDYDNLVAGLKPFLDILKCRFFRGKTSRPDLMTWSGVIYDDSPKYVKWDIEQRLARRGEDYGCECIEVTVEEGQNP